MRRVRGCACTRLAATLITKQGRPGSCWKRRSDTACLLRFDRGRFGMLAIAVELALAGRDLDLSRFDALGLRDAQGEHAILESGGRLVGLQPVGQCQASGETAAADLLETNRTGFRGTRGCGVAGDRE